jgi:hypothetical protein
MTGIILSFVSTIAAICGIYFGTDFAKQATETGNSFEKTASHDENPKSLFVTSDVIVSPIIEENSLRGYIVAKYAMSLVEEGKKPLSVPNEILLNDAFYTSIYESRSYDSVRDTIPDASVITDSFLAAANRSAGSMRFENALLQQFDVFEPGGMRRKNVQERSIKEAEKTEKTAKSADKH